MNGGQHQSPANISPSKHDSNIFQVPATPHTQGSGRIQFIGCCEVAFAVNSETKNSQQCWSCSLKRAAVAVIISLLLQHKKWGTEGNKGCLDRYCQRMVRGGIRFSTLLQYVFLIGTDVGRPQWRDTIISIIIYPVRNTNLAPHHSVGEDNSWFPAWVMFRHCYSVQSNLGCLVKNLCDKLILENVTLTQLWTHFKQLHRDIITRTLTARFIVI